eukprot:4466381-Amphidinium_carterae.2
MSASGAASSGTPPPPMSVPNPNGVGFRRVPEPPTPKGVLYTCGFYSALALAGHGAIQLDMLVQFSSIGAWCFDPSVASIASASVLVMVPGHHVASVCFMSCLCWIAAVLLVHVHIGTLYRWELCLLSANMASSSASSPDRVPRLDLQPIVRRREGSDTTDEDSGSVLLAFSERSVGSSTHWWGSYRTDLAAGVNDDDGIGLRNSPAEGPL